MPRRAPSYNVHICILKRPLSSEHSVDRRGSDVSPSDCRLARQQREVARRVVVEPERRPDEEDEQKDEDAQSVVLPSAHTLQHRRKGVSTSKPEREKIRPVRVGSREADGDATPRRGHSERLGVVQTRERLVRPELVVRPAITRDELLPCGVQFGGDADAARGDPVRGDVDKGGHLDEIQEGEPLQARAQHVAVLPPGRLGLRSR
mmetsp:Transcript_7406/g.30649  ORF Transcript_7406/g.30649 Transcript_7406/m.30649 type:complete len:205 (-) Transcript_7406:379-993(-)